MENNVTFLDQLKSYFSSTKVLLFLVLGGVMVTIPLIFFMIYGYQASKKAETTVGKVSNITPTLAPTLAAVKDPVAFLDFSTSTIDFSIKAPETTGVDIIINSPTEKVSGAEIELTYDPTIITKVALTPAIDAASFFGEKVLVTALTNDTANGKIIFSLQVPSTDLARSGRGKIATLAFTPIKKAGVKDAKVQYTKDKSALIKQTAASHESLPTGRIDLDILF